MKLPKSPPEHISERESWKILDNCLPSEWILRDVTGRDYGIDCYIELVNKDNEITGNLISVQLKSNNELEWKKRRGSSRESALFSGIKIATVNYWMKLPVPTFLCIAELKSKSIYFATIENQVRKRYNLFNRQKTFSFYLDKHFNLSRDNGIINFLASYFRELSHKSFSFYLITLLNNAESYLDFLGWNLERDAFLEVETDRLLVMFNMYKYFQSVAQYLGIRWRITSIYDAIQKDRKTFEQPSILLHELTFGNLLKEMLPVMIDVLAKSKDLILNEQKYYWQTKEYLLFEYCQSRQFEDTIKELIEVNKAVIKFERKRTKLYA